MPTQISHTHVWDLYDHGMSKIKLENTIPVKRNKKQFEVANNSLMSDDLDQKKYEQSGIGNPYVNFGVYRK